MIYKNNNLSLKIKRFTNTLNKAFDITKGALYFSVSGGNDSRIMLFLAKNVLHPAKYESIIKVCVASVECKENLSWLIKNVSKDELVFLRSEKPYWEYWKEKGIPIISKKTSMGLNRYQNTKSELQKKLRLFGGINPTSGKKQRASISKKYHWMANHKQKFSESCCNFSKEKVLKKFAKKNKLNPIIGTRIEESVIRLNDWQKYGCNAFKGVGFQSRPLSLFTDEDIKALAKEFDIALNPTRTGCLGCPMGCKSYSEYIERLDRELKHLPRRKEKILKTMNENNFLNDWKKVSL